MHQGWGERLSCEIEFAIKDLPVFKEMQNAKNSGTQEKLMRTGRVDGTGREKLKVLQLDLKIYLTCFSSEDAWKTVHEKDKGQLAETNI